MFSKMLIVLIMTIASMAHAATLQTNPDSKTKGNVSGGEFKYYEFSKSAKSKHTVCLKTTSGDADLYGHWTSNVSNRNWQFRSWNGGVSYDCISFEAGQTGQYYLAVHGYRDSSYEIYAVKNSMEIPWQMEHKLVCPLGTSPPASCGELTSTKYGPFGATWGNSEQDPFFKGPEEEPDKYLDYFHVGVDWKTNYNDPIYAVADGKVKRAGFSGLNWGYYVVIEHNVDGYVFTATYEHLRDAASKKIELEKKESRSIKINPSDKK